MLKKIVSVLIIFLLLSGNIFAYSPIKNEQNYIDKVTTKIYYAYKKDPKTVEKIVDKIEAYLKKNPNTSERNKYILNNVLYYIHELKLIMSKKDNTKADESLSSLLDGIEYLKNDDSFSKLFPEYDSIMKEKFVYDDSNDNSNNSNNSNNNTDNSGNNSTNYTYNSNTSNCNKSLGSIVSNYSKISVTVSTLSGLESAINTANARSDTSKRYEIIIKDGTYNLTSGLSIKGNKIIIRGETGDASDVIIKGKGMKSGISHGFWVSGDNTVIGDLSIAEVKNHAIQIHGEKDSDNLLVHNVEIYNTGEQMLKGSYDSNYTSKGSDNGIVECSKFYYTSDYGPQYYIGGIDVHNGKNWIVRNNTFNNIRSPESSLAEHAIHFWSNSENTIVENNIIINSDRGIGFGLGDKGHKYGIIRNNFIYHDSSKGDVGIGLENSLGTKVYNNTIYQKHSYANAIEYRFSTSKDIEIINNLTNKNISKRDNASATLEKNITDASSNVFKDIESLDFSLKSTATNIIDSGKNLNLVKYDLFGHSRDSETDIGAYEYNGSTSSSTSTNTNTSNNGNYSNSSYCIDESERFDIDASFSKHIYVDPNSNNSSRDGSQSNPYRNLSDAINNVIPGTVIHLAAGTYAGGNYITNFKGTSNNPIKILGPTVGEAIISGGNTGIQLVDPSYVIIKNITVEKSSENGINIDDGGSYDSPAHHIIIDNVKIKNIGSNGNNDFLKLSGVDDFYVFDSDFSDAVGTGGSGIDMVGCHDGNIFNNTFYNLGANFIQTKGGSKDILIKNNTFKKVAERGINMGGSTGGSYFRPSISSDINYEAKNITVVNNTFIDTDSAVAFVGCVNCNASYNVIYKPRTWVFRVLQETTSLNGITFLQSQNNTFSNNIIAFKNDIRTLVNVGPSTKPETFTLNNNLRYALDNDSFDYSSSKADLPVDDYGALVQVDPIFVNESEENFALKSDSPMYNKFYQSSSSCK
ncbi:hypothetical protein EOM39_01945 [Candidatus Gracilibacteria bacterium]|nr:hypothetical protein [Candidatus Gracilibacteria bacterium]